MPHSNWKQSKAAELLSLQRTSLSRLLEKKHPPKHQGILTPSFCSQKEQSFRSRSFCHLLSCLRQKRGKSCSQPFSVISTKEKRSSGIPILLVIQIPIQNGDLDEEAKIGPIKGSEGLKIKTSIGLVQTGKVRLTNGLSSCPCICIL